MERQVELTFLLSCASNIKMNTKPRDGVYGYVNNSNRPRCNCENLVYILQQWLFESNSFISLIFDLFEKKNESMYKA